MQLVPPPNVNKCISLDSWVSKSVSLLIDFIGLLKEVWFSLSESPSVVQFFYNVLQNAVLMPLILILLNSYSNLYQNQTLYLEF